MVQMTMSNIEEDILASRMRYVQALLNDLVEDVETRMLQKEALKERVQSVERALKKTRDGF
jgi:hypothetical protein